MKKHRVYPPLAVFTRSLMILTAIVTHALLGGLCGGLCGALCGSVAHAQTAYESPGDHWIANSFGLSSSSEYFMSNSNYDTTRGSFNSLLNGNSFASFESDLRARYNWTRRASVFAQVGFANVHANDVQNSKTNTEITALSLGGDFILSRKFVTLIPELQAGYALDHTDPNQVTPLTSDGVSFVRAGVFAHRWLRHFRIGGYAGLNVPFEALAGRFLYQATFDWNLSPMFSIGAGLDGYETVISDSTSFLIRDGTALRADAGSERFYAFNPALLEGRLWVGYRVDKTFAVKLGYAKTLNGMDQAQGQSVLLWLAYNMPSSAHEDSNVFTARPRRTMNPEKAVEGFSPDVEPTEQGIFEEEQEETEGVSPPKTKSNLDSTEKMLEKKNDNP